MGAIAQIDDDEAKRLKPRPLLSFVALRWLAAAALCVLYMSVSTGLILLNKYLMTIDGFEYPLALSSSGMAFSSVASFATCKVRIGKGDAQSVSTSTGVEAGGHKAHHHSALLLDAHDARRLFHDSHALLWQQGVPVPHRQLYSDAQGAWFWHKHTLRSISACRRSAP